MRIKGIKKIDEQVIGAKDSVMREANWIKEVIREKECAMEVSIEGKWLHISITDFSWKVWDKESVFLQTRRQYAFDGDKYFKSMRIVSKEVQVDERDEGKKS